MDNRGSKSVAYNYVTAKEQRVDGNCIAALLQY
jgi:hypothetical protein